MMCSNTGALVRPLRPQRRVPSWPDKMTAEIIDHTPLRPIRRHVVLPQDVARMLPKGKLLSEMEWRTMGVQQSRGWVHYAIHRPEPHIMLFRRPLGTVQ